MQNIGIIVPTTPEQGPLLALLKEMTGREAEVVEHGIWHIQRVQMQASLISIIHSGPGMVNAGAATEALVIYEHPQALINYGIAGAHTHEALPGDIIIATQVCAPFNGYLETGGVLNSTFGIRWDDDAAEVYHQRATQRFTHLPCDPTLVSMALQAAQVLVEQHALTIVAPPGQEVRPARIFSGVIASADTYCRDETTFSYIRDTFGSLGEDMESAAVGQVAARHELPFTIIRCLSNNDLLEILTEERKRTIYPEMARRSALVTARLLALLTAKEHG
ncbi:MAG: 5'-methylthioadenosine/adenosylhomocysteine nucleosidase [Ktedonobacteraceae bacterium]